MILTEANYFSKEANIEYMSVSQLKAFETCEDGALAQMNELIEREETPALLVGSYVDAHFSHALDLFKAHHPDIVKKDGTLKADYIKADDVIARIESDQLLRFMLEGDTQTIKAGYISGVKFKIKIDSLLSAKQCEAITSNCPSMARDLLLADGAIVDLKVMRDFKPIYVPGQGRLSFVEAWRYDLQLAVYQRVEGHNLPCFIAAASKEKSPDIVLIRVPQYMLDAALEGVMNKIPYYAALKRGDGSPQRCGHCDWCKQTKVIMEAISADMMDEEAEAVESE